MDGLNTTQIHIDELDREIESIRIERFLRDAAVERPSLPRRARAGLGRSLISLGDALVGEARAPSRTVHTNGQF